jgi:uncharacterized protein (TIGR04255 family)
VAKQLPEYSDPPVVETVLGVEFAPLRGWTVVHFGLFHEVIKHEFPEFEEVAAVVSSERYSDDMRVQDEHAGALSGASGYVRCLYIDHDKDRLVQVQPDRFMYNWRREVKKNYPRYLGVVRPGFIEQWQRFNEFLRAQNIDGPRVRRCEVTYVNHFERGRVWNSTADLPEVLAFWAATAARHADDAIPTPRFLPDPEYADVDLRYRINDQDHLQVDLRRAERRSDAGDILQLTLTARLSAGTGDDASILAAFDTGREWIVRGFTELTTERMHKLWGRTQ